MATIVFTKYKSDSALSKEFTLENDEIENNSAAYMTNGQAEQLSTDIEGFAELLPTFSSNEALGFGVHDAERYGDCVGIRTKSNAQPDQGILSRTKEYFKYANAPGMMMLDHDPSGEHAIDPVRLMAYLTTICPQLKKVGTVTRGSVSAGVHKTGQKPSHSKGFHIYIGVNRADDIPRIGAILFNRLWLLGLGYITITSAGTMLLRTYIDATVFSPERLDFAGKPVLKSDGLAYTPPEAVHHPGQLLATSQIKDLTDAEAAEVDRLQAEAKRAMADEADNVRADWELAQRAKLEERGVTSDQIEAAMSRLGSERSDLSPDWVLEFSDGRAATVREVLENGLAFDEASLADPIEGLTYGSEVAKFYWNNGRSSVVHSFAHGSKHVYFLKTDYRIPEDWERKLSAMIDHFNEEYALSMIGCKSVLVSIKRDAQLECTRTVYTGIPACRDLMRNQIIQTGLKTGDRPIYKNHLDAWMDHPDRRTYKAGVIFDPSGVEDPDVYNLWNGYAIEPLPGSCKTILRFLRYVICSGNKQHYDYVLKWLARSIQRPQDIGEVALVLRGKKGSGKTTLGEIMRRIFGNNYLLLDDPNLLTRGFNAHLRECVFAVADEAVFAGDKRTSGKLKSQITSTTMNLERKGYDVETVPSRLTLVIISNDDHIIDATGDERRYFPLEVSDQYIGDTGYFDGLYKAINGDELRCFFRMMMAFDISEFNHRVMPNTDEMRQQQALSLKPVDQWLCEIGCRGDVYPSIWNSGEFDPWQEVVAMDLLVSSMSVYAREKKVSTYDTVSRQQLGTRLASMFLKTRQHNLPVVVGCKEAGIEVPRVVRCNQQKTAYRLGSLDEYRAALIQHLKLPENYFDNV